MSSTFSIRRITADEGARLRSVRLAMLADQPGDSLTTIERTAGLGDDHWESAAYENAAGQTQATFFAEATHRSPDEDAIGLIGAYANQHGVIDIVGLWSAPGFRAVGVAEGLLDAVRSWACDGGGRRLRRWVLERNEHTRAFYERYGFVSTGNEMPHGSEPSLNQVEMVLDL